MINHLNFLFWDNLITWKQTRVVWILFNMTMYNTEEQKMYIFTFTEKEVFNGDLFLQKYQNADFVTPRNSNNNIVKILSQREELAKCVSNMAPGDQLTMQGMFIRQGVPLVIKKSGCPHESDLLGEEFTLRRLGGLVATLEHSRIAAGAFSKVGSVEGEIPEAEALGLSWSPDIPGRHLYLAAVPGTEYFTWFQSLPFLCAARKFDLNMISEEEFRRIADIPLNNQPLVKRALVCWTNYVHYFKGKTFDLEEIIRPLGIYNSYIAH